MSLPRRIGIWFLSILLVAFPVFVFASSRFPKPSVVDGSLLIHSVNISWEKQQNVKHYKLRLFNSDCSTLIKTYKLKKAKNKKKIKGLDPATSYCIRMRAQFTDGTHDRFSKKLTFTTLDPAKGQFGVNFIRFFSDENDALSAATQPAVIDADFSALGVDTFRQITSGDLIWSNVESDNGTYDFTDEDAVLMTTTHMPIVDLFSYQYANSTAPWESLGGTGTGTTLTAEAEEYIGTTVDRYKDYVKYWEIGNELAHWELTNPGEFSAAEQGLWLQSVAEVIRAHDPDAVILLPGLISITTDNVDDWLTPVIDSAGTDWFDIVNYHYYSRWQAFDSARAALQTLIDTAGIGDKPVWMTETGTSSDSSNSQRTDYPNSTNEQAADIFRRALMSYAAGDTLVEWHTYIGNDESDQDFRYFGLVNEDLSKQPAYYSVQLLTSEIIPFSSVEKESDYVYKVTRTDGSVRYVAWSGTTGSLTVPSGMSSQTSVVPDSSGNFSWTNVTTGSTISLTDIPVVLK